MSLTPEQRERKLARARERRAAQTPEQRALRNAYARARRQDPKVQEQERAAHRRYLEKKGGPPTLTPEQKARRALIAKIRIQNDPEYKPRRAAQARARRENPEVRERDYAAWRRWRDKRRAYLKEYRNKPENIERRRERDRKRYLDPNYHIKAQARTNAANQAKRILLAGRRRPDVCEICGRQENHKDGLVFDHCHKSGKFRGWICRSCNWTLGLVEDNSEILLKLLAYLSPAQD